MTLEFFVSGKPEGQTRHRTRVVKKNNPVTGKVDIKVHTYHEKGDKCSVWREAVAYMARKKMSEHGARKLEGPLEATLVFTRVPPKKPLHPKWLVTTPDTDNLQKAVLDALNGIAYHDDSTIVRITAEKTYSTVPGVHIKLTELEAQ